LETSSPDREWSLFDGTAVLVSACLVGIRCRYDGGEKADPAVTAALCGKLVIPVCPEQLGGLATPRPASVIRNDNGFAVLDGRGRVVNETGADVTGHFIRGAQQTLLIATLNSIREFVAKERSPSCGLRQIVRNGTPTEGPGVTTALLVRAGLRVITEEDLGG
jgi:uncharacterized protein YbbK (DUF523 family)